MLPRRSHYSLAPGHCRSRSPPHCAHFTQEVLPQIRANYIEKGYVRYVYREFPLDRVALAASVAGRCLAREAYLPYIEMMYSELQTWATQQDQRGAIKEMARRAGMSGDDRGGIINVHDLDGNMILRTP